MFAYKIYISVNPDVYSIIGPAPTRSSNQAAPIDVKKEEEEEKKYEFFAGKKEEEKEKY